jgi:hypothetical protein
MGDFQVAITGGFWVAIRGNNAGLEFVLLSRAKKQSFLHYNAYL